MRFRMLFLLLAALPFVASAQTDTTRTVPAEMEEHRHTLSLGMGSKGVHASVDRVDSTTRPDDPDTIRIISKHKIIRIITSRRTDVPSTDSLADRLDDARGERRNLFTYWSGVDIGLNTFITESGDLGDGKDSGPLKVNNGNSRFFAINIMEQKVEFGDHRAGFYTGLGVEFLNYRLAEDAVLHFNTDSTYSVPADNIDISKSKLRQIGLRVPLMFEFNTKRAPLPGTAEEWKAYGEKGFSRKGNFHIAVGVIGSWYFDRMYKLRYSEDGEHHQFREKADYNLLPYRLAATVRFGIGGLNLFAEYGLTDMFENGTASKLTPLNVGLTLAAFN
ncbi:MAG TPA: hypothetical protein VHL57_06300 [Flavobacteriales bacterium]|jgi:hypothetical protein|nr:hypothetical protein [Flavobacteriales bacterium]